MLILAGLLESVIPLLIIRSDGYSDLPIVGLLAITVVGSLLGLRHAMRKIPLSIAYMVWTAMGILGTSLVGATVLNESVTRIEIASLLLIVAAVAGLRTSAAPT